MTPTLEQLAAPAPNGSHIDTRQVLLQLLCKMQRVEELAQSARRLEVTLPSGVTHAVKGTPHPELAHVVKLCHGCIVNDERKRIHCLLVGPAGSGKTYLARQVAETLGLRFAFISCSAGMGEGQLLGRLLPTGDGGKFEYARSEFVRCYEEGGVFLFDEVDAADVNTLLILNTALSNGHLAVPNRAAKPYAQRHDDFVCVAAANTFGTGADRQYVGRNQLDEAFLDRFRMGQIELDYAANVEEYLCPDRDLRERLQRYRRRCEECKIRRVVSTRSLENAYALKVMGVSDDRIDKALFGGWRPDEITKVKGY